MSAKAMEEASGKIGAAKGLYNAAQTMQKAQEGSTEAEQ